MLLVKRLQPVPIRVLLVCLEPILPVISLLHVVCVKLEPSPVRVRLHVRLARLDGSPRVWEVLSVLRVPKDTILVEEPLLVLPVQVESSNLVTPRIAVMIA